jgi:hypothetical protein
MTAGVAVYAALVATASLGWQVYSWNVARRPKLSVTITEAADDPGRASIMLKNRGGFAVRWVSAGVVLQNAPVRSSDERFIFRFPSNGRLPRSIDPQDSGVLWVGRGSLAAFVDLGKPVTVFAQTATNDYYFSKPTRLWGDALKQEEAELEEAARRQEARR